jgi:transposase-like protein
MRFEPPFCPYADCPAHTARPFRYQRRGIYLRACDGRRAQRFLCLECNRSFSAQRFRLDFRLQRPRLHLDLWSLFISKVTQRQSARLLHCDRKSVARRLDLLGEHCRAWHRTRLARRPLVGTFQLDELETFEHSRRLQPVTVPVLIQRGSYLVVDLGVGPLPCRGGLTPADRRRKAEREARHGKRRSGSRAAVERCLETLRSCLGAGGGMLESDRKASYAASLRRVLGEGVAHVRRDSRGRRDYGHALFPINHTLAQLRDGVSRLVRRSWGASKRREKLELHLWIWACWRNYVRGITNRARNVTPAMAAGLERRPFGKEELLAWRVTG